MRTLLLLFSISGIGFAQEKVIFDTDCAFFNDDGAALVMLLQRPEKIEVLGLTVVPGNVWPLQGAEYMFHILDLMKKPGVPLFLGARAPLMHTKAMVEKENTEWGPVKYMGAFRTDPPAPKKTTERRASGKNAVDFLAETLGKYPEPVTILALGPMTNLAIALRMHPEIERKIKRIVFMGGGVHVKNEDDGRAAEFNFWFDPQAASIVLRSAIPEKVMFGLDISYRAPIDKDHYDQIAAVKTPVTALMRQDVGKRYEKDPAAKAYAWDCVPAAYLLDPAIVTRRESAYLDVDTTFGKNYGAVIPLDRSIAPDATPVDVALDLDFPKFYDLYKTLLTKAP